MSYLIVLLVGVTLGVSLGHKSALQQIRGDVAAEFLAIRDWLKQIEGQL
jgi:hypothetical protein